MCFYDIITQAQSQSRSLAGWLGGEEGLKYLVQHLFRNTGAVVFYLYQHMVFFFFLSYRYRWFVTGLVFLLSFRYGVEGVIDQVEDHPAQVLG